MIIKVITMQKANNILFQEDWYDLTKPMTDASFGKVIRVIMASVFEGKEPPKDTDLEPMEYMALNYILPKIKASKENYQMLCKKREEAAKAKWNKQQEQNIIGAMQVDASGCKCIQVQSDANGNIQVQTDKEREREREKEKERESTKVDKKASSKEEAVTEPQSSNDLIEGKTKGKILAIVKSYFNTQVEFNHSGITPIKLLRGKRGDSVIARVKESSLVDVKTMIEKATKSDFLGGVTGQWKATFDWLFLPNNFPKVLEGNYDNTEPKQEEVQISEDEKQYNAFLAYCKKEVPNYYGKIEQGGFHLYMNMKRMCGSGVFQYMPEFFKQIGINPDGDLYFTFEKAMRKVDAEEAQKRLNNENGQTGAD